MVVFGGFMEVTPDKVVVLADTAENVEEIDVARAEEARRNAEQEVANRQSTVDLAEAQASLRRATIRLRTAERRRGGRRRLDGPPGQ